MPPSLTAQPQTLFCTVASFHGAVKTKSEKKARPKSLLPAVGLEGNTEREESLHCSVHGCGTRRARGWALQPGFSLEFMSARSLQLCWGLPGTEGSESAWCVCQGLWAAGQGILRALIPVSHNHSTAGIILIDCSSLLVWFLVYKWICRLRWFVHLVQQRCLSTPSVLQQQSQYLGLAGKGQQIVFLMVSNALWKLLGLFWTWLLVSTEVKGSAKALADRSVMILPALGLLVWVSKGAFSCKSDPPHPAEGTWEELTLQNKNVTGVNPFLVLNIRFWEYSSVVVSHSLNSVFARCSAVVWVSTRQVGFKNLSEWSQALLQNELLLGELCVPAVLHASGSPCTGWQRRAVSQAQCE